jgi:serine/threonine protein kinase
MPFQRNANLGHGGQAGLEEVASPVSNTGPLGTVGYVAPEAVLGQRTTERSDIFALGVMAYEMLSGELPYGEGFASAKRVDKLNYAPLSNHLPDIAPWIEGAIARAVHKDPARRYNVLSEFIEDLSRPNPAFEALKARPLIERNPAAVWRTVSLILMLIILWLLR